MMVNADMAVGVRSQGCVAMVTANGTMLLDRASG